jgi:hypothetical protein
MWSVHTSLRSWSTRTCTETQEQMSPVTGDTASLHHSIPRSLTSAQGIHTYVHVHSHLNVILVGQRPLFNVHVQCWTPQRDYPNPVPNIAHSNATSLRVHVSHQSHHVASNRKINLSSRKAEWLSLSLPPSPHLNTARLLARQCMALTTSATSY